MGRRAAFCNPVISYQDGSNDDLELHVCGDPTCTTGTNHALVTAGWVGAYSSVAIGVDGNPVISHYDQNNTDLELAIPMFRVTGIALE